MLFIRSLVATAELPDTVTVIAWSSTKSPYFERDPKRADVAYKETGGGARCAAAREGPLGSESRVCPVLSEFALGASRGETPRPGSAYQVNRSPN